MAKGTWGGGGYTKSKPHTFVAGRSKVSITTKPSSLFSKTKDVGDWYNNRNRRTRYGRVRRKGLVARQASEVRDYGRAKYGFVSKSHYSPTRGWTPYRGK